MTAEQVARPCPPPRFAVRHDRMAIPVAWQKIPPDKSADFDLSCLTGLDARRRSRAGDAPNNNKPHRHHGRNIMRTSPQTRRRFLTSTAATAAALAMPYVRGAHAAGRLSIGFWDHWVPGGNNASKALCEEWAAKEKVDISIDYITSQGNKNLLTIAAEAQARSGHDIFAFPTWEPQAHAKDLEPVDDIMTELVKDNGKVNPTVEYLARANNKWVAVPATVGSQIKGPCSRIDLMKKHAGIDVQALYPAGAPPQAEAWTLDALLKAAE